MIEAQAKIQMQPHETSSIFNLGHRLGENRAEVVPEVFEPVSFYYPDAVVHGMGRTATEKYGFELTGLEQARIPGPVYHTEYDPTDGDTEVHVASSVTQEQTELAMIPRDRERVNDLVEKSRNLNIFQVNATDKGGGVARINKARAHTLKTVYGLNYEWHALELTEEEADVTKGKFHNVLQNVQPEGTVLTQKDELVYEGMIARNFEKMKDKLAAADVIHIDDMQPVGLIKYIKGYWEETSQGQVWHKGVNPDAVLIVQDHIQTEAELMDTPGTPQYITWQYLWKWAKQADVLATHPVKDFAPLNVPKEILVYLTANCDLNDDYHREMSPQEFIDTFNLINEELRLNENQSPIVLDERLDPAREFQLVSARMDEAKGLDLSIEMYLKERAMLLESGVSEEDLPQFVIQGFGSRDDTSGEKILKEMMDLRALAGSLDPAVYGQNITDDIKIIRTPNNDLIFNALMWKASLVLQPSIKEGMEDAVSGANFHHKFVLGSNRGGIPHQILNGKNGLVLDPYDTDSWAKHMHDHHMMDELSRKRVERNVKEVAKTHNYDLITTGPNIINFLALIQLLIKKDREGFKGMGRWPRDIYYAKEEAAVAA